MKNLAPNITRERLLIEGFYTIDVDEGVIKSFFAEITLKLSLRMYGKPIIFLPEGMGSDENQGYDAFVPLIDSGISLYVWTHTKFFSVVIYTRKTFDVASAIEVAKNFFKSDRIEHASF